MHRNADGARLIGDSARDRLTDPPGGVRGELEALGVVEFLHRANKAEIALLDEVEEQHAAADVALRDGDDQAKVGLDELLLGIEPHLLDTGEAALLATLELDALLLGTLKLLGSGHARLDLHGEIDLLRGGEQRNFADLLQVHADGVSGEHGDVRIGVAFARTRLRTRANLRQRDVDGGLELLLGNALKQILVAVDARFYLILGKRVGIRFDRLHGGRLDVLSFVIVGQLVDNAVLDFFRCLRRFLG